MNKCKIIQDLLPNYVENLTSNETNEFIEMHLKECKECEKSADIMKKGIDAEQKKLNKQIDYLKKYKRKMVILKAIISIIVIFVIVFLGNRLYNWQLISKIYDRNVEYDIGTNYKIIVRDGRTGDITELLYKDGIGIYRAPNNNYIWTNKDLAYMIIEDENQYVELEEGSPATIIDETVTLPTQGIFGSAENKLQLLKLSLFKNISIHSEEYGDLECYVILTDGEKVWVDKDSLFIVRIDSEGRTKEFFIETDTITDNDITLPDLSSYTKIN